MALKKANNSEIIDDFENKSKIDEFIAGADTKSESKPKKTTKRQKVLDTFVGTILHSHQKIEFKKRARGVYTLNTLMKHYLLKELPHFSNDDIVYIYQKSRQENISMGDFVRLRLGMINDPISIKPLNQSLQEAPIKFNKNVACSTTEKEIITKTAFDLSLSVLKYSEIKFTAYYELESVLTPNDILRLSKEATEYNLDLKSYLNIKLKS